MAEEIIVAEVGGPAIGGKDGAVEIVVQTPEHADEAAIVNVMVAAVNGAPEHSFTSTL